MRQPLCSVPDILEVHLEGRRFMDHPTFANDT
jgi:hypothetical protein